MQYKKPNVSNRSGNFKGLSVVALFLALVALACDSLPWSRFIVANSSSSEITVRFYTRYPTMASPYLYSTEEWKEKEHFSSGTPLDRFKINEDEGWIEAVVVPGAAVEIDEARYPDVEKDPESNFLIDRLEIQGESGEISWKGRSEIFKKMDKEGEFLPELRGRSPRYVYYYK